MLFRSVYLFLGRWQRYGELSKQRLDCAILTFLQQFRKSFVGDYALHSSKVSEFEIQTHTFFPFFLVEFDPLHVPGWFFAATICSTI